MNPLLVECAILATFVGIYSVKTLRQLIWPKVQTLHRIFTVLSYLVPFAFQATIYRPPTQENARWFRRLTLAIWLPLTTAFHTFSAFGLLASSSASTVLQYFLWFYAVDLPFFVCVVSATSLTYIFERKSTNRIFGGKPSFNGNKIVVLGNGPSLVKGEPYGKLIDGMDEVVRFNNFQTRASGLLDWTGSKTTVHFSDSMLFPSYPEYKVPGATVTLSLFMDRLMVAGSYLIFRGAIDLAISETYAMLGDSALGWIPHEDIEVLKKTLDISYWKHPTSGCLAIDYFVRNRPDPKVPVYIHGFDFFEGPEIHYYNKTEPLYERINDLIGVTTMHQPHKEKAFVARLVEEGKVKWLKDLSEETSTSATLLESQRSTGNTKAKKRYA